ncbi:hypothetical protein F5879DRAFT_300416 [Lentinula edodes]|nr:hypothetical protein F5879DRAFT_300416 [Lentinula edodes]
MQHFHRFIDELTERGVDMSKVKISKAEAALWGIEHIGKWKKKQSHLKEAGKERIAKAGHAIVDTLKMSDPSWKREIVEGKKRQEDQAPAIPDLPEKGPSQSPGQESISSDRVGDAEQEAEYISASNPAPHTEHESPGKVLLEEA